MEERLIDVSRTTEANVSHMTNQGEDKDEEKKWGEAVVGERQRQREIVCRCHYQIL